MKITPENYKEYLPEGYKLIVKHNSLNSGKGDMPITEYGSIREFGTDAYIIKDGYVITSASSLCHPSDKINKRKGWEIAVGRVFKNSHKD